jgi:hypothetical protein
MKKINPQTLPAGARFRHYDKDEVWEVTPDGKAQLINPDLSRGITCQIAPTLAYEVEPDGRDARAFAAWARYQAKADKAEAAKDIQAMYNHPPPDLIVKNLTPVKAGPMYFSNSSQARKDRPLFRGCLSYFPAALALVSVLSKKGNDKHNPGQEMHHSRVKSSDHGDCILRHQVDVGSIDPEMDLDHAVEVAWRALAQLQELAEKRYGWPRAPAASPARGEAE